MLVWDQSFIRAAGVKSDEGWQVCPTGQSSAGYSGQVTNQP